MITAGPRLHQLVEPRTRSPRPWATCGGGREGLYEEDVKAAADWGQSAAPPPRRPMRCAPPVTRPGKQVG